MLLTIILPILRSRPAFDIGMPVWRAIFCLACVTPSALFREKDNPGIFIFIRLVASPTLARRRSRG